MLDFIRALIDLGGGEDDVISVSCRRHGSRVDPASAG